MKASVNARRSLVPGGSARGWVVEGSVVGEGVPGADEGDNVESCAEKERLAPEMS
jgi:hypothetical protein